MGLSQDKGTILGVPIIRIILFGGLHWGPLSRETIIWSHLRRFVAQEMAGNTNDTSPQSRRSLDHLGFSLNS